MPALPPNPRCARFPTSHTLRSFDTDRDRVPSMWIQRAAESVTSGVRRPASGARPMAYGLRPTGE